MDGSYLGKGFRALFLSLLFLVSLFYYYYHYSNFSLYLLLFFVALLGIIFLGYPAFQSFMFVEDGDNFMLFLISAILVLHSL